MRLVYRVPSPLDALITDTALAEYNRIGRFLLHVRRAKYALEQQTVPRERASRLLRQLCFVRAKLLQFVNNLDNYLMTRVVHGVWAEYRDRFPRAASLDELCALHAEYQVARPRALNATAAVVLDAIERMLALVMKLRQVYELLTGAAAQPGAASERSRAAAQLEHIDSDFTRVHRFLLTILSNILQKRGHSYLEEILLRINFNNFFSAG